MSRWRRVPEAQDPAEVARVEASRLRRGRKPARQIVCRDVVELITDYLDDAVPADERARIDRHLEGCVDCARALAQWREVIALTGRLRGDEVDRLDPGTRDGLLAAFREHPVAPD